MPAMPVAVVASTAVVICGDRHRGCPDSVPVRALQPLG
ncbi:hypothetical protein BZL30_7355 [Mycobacterium kansasii]|uniref:Uncharacterized protein n=1 Tax=Mycobacterium kansasii TaxID=1768 RepID=A0A1V3WQB1_MYCKA|nr:hypothetical protein BZL30_7355 [Mycobacterium kansasii]OOK69699.1 hypothetical protein BZL29_6452 [Mycobacterium kansasii]